LNEKTDSDQKRMAAEKKLAAITLEMKETLIAFESRAIALKKSEEELRIKTLETRRNLPTVGPNADIYDAIQSLGNRMEDGMHHFNNLAASKNRLEQAVKRWEAMYCEPTIKIIKLQAHVHAEKEKHRKEYSRQMKVLNENAEELKQSAARHVTIARALGEERAVFDEEQEKWRMQKAQELEGTELEAVQELWLSTQEERVKAEVKKQTETEVRRTVEPHIRAECAKAQEEGCKAGYVAGIYDGVKKGHLEGQVYATTIWRERVTSAENASRNNSYTAGRAQGHADGRREGYNVGISDGFNIGLAASKREGARERGETNQQSYERGRDEGHSQGHYEGYAKGFAQGLDAVEQEEGGTA
jgi:hypothetical protein